ncbi:MAG: hypothetical protein FH748_10275 [Balneolaceae bacterium]|nr:hypothetical protein [Balneolaceae bacterium]
MSLKHDLLILGSQNAKTEDQKLSRSEVKPVQVLTKAGQLKPIHFFNGWGEVGVSSIAWHSRYKDELFVSVNDEIRRLNIYTRNYQVLLLESIGDIHDICFIDGLLWISNTEYDEAIAYDPRKEEEVRRISLDSFRMEPEGLDENEEYEKVKDRFHCNQVFKNYDGDLCVLIHSISGWQFYRVIFEMLVKKQGDGGVINLDTGEVKQLRLQSPHSVRLVNNEYWVQDSGDLSTKIYSRSWEHIDTIKTGGFGRGYDCDEGEDIAYTGLSATRKRYLKIIPTLDHLANRIFVSEIKSRKKIDEIPLLHIEQVDNVHILDEQLRHALNCLSD